VQKTGWSPGARFVHQAFGVFTRTIKTQRDHRIDLRIGFGNARLGSVKQLQWRHLAARQFCDSLSGSPFYEFRHRRIPVITRICPAV
jgi:hypothetical protein